MEVSDTLDKIDKDEQRKVNKYQDLARKLRRQWKQKLSQ